MWSGAAATGTDLGCRPLRIISCAPAKSREQGVDARLDLPAVLVGTGDVPQATQQFFVLQQPETRRTSRDVDDVTPWA
jgi:hypothetical protein